MQPIGGIQAAQSPAVTWVPSSSTRAFWAAGFCPFQQLRPPPFRKLRPLHAAIELDRIDVAYVERCLVGAERRVDFFTDLGGTPVRVAEAPSFSFVWSDDGAIDDVLGVGDLDGDDRGEGIVPLAWSTPGIQRVGFARGGRTRSRRDRRTGPATAR